ncbi:MAG: ketoacyl-ACP synthase III [Bacteroidales bacterium]|nr:ketoacyl-ACP synthase III [Bacteroidales bacterium]
MAFIEIKNVAIKGVAAAVPERKEFNKDFPKLSEEQLGQYIKTVGVVERRCAIHDGSLCTSDLCFEAAEKLLGDLGWSREDIGLLVFVSHTQDYKLPSTACILQARLGLSKETMAFDVPLGCSGFVYGLGIAGGILSQGFIKKALLLVGNTQSVYASPEDKSTALLFGDAGSAIALEFDQSQEESIKLHFQTDGSGFENLIVPDGGCRHPFNEHSLDMEEFDEGIRRTRIHEKMDGGAVFTFGFFSVPKSLNALIKQFGIDIESVDYLLLHQANKFMCDNIRMKFKFSEKKVPSNIDRFGNTSGASIPLLMVTELQEQLRSQKLRHLACGFGVGLSLGSACFCTDHIVVPALIDVKQ